MAPGAGHNTFGNRLQTFSIGFEDASFDESAPARQVAQFLGLSITRRS